MRRVGQVSWYLLASMGLAMPVLAQDPVMDISPAGPRFYYAASAKAEPVRLDVKRTPVLSRRITLDLHDVTLEVALEEIRRKAGLKLMYSKRLIPLEKKVSIKAEDITVASTLAEVLFEEEVDVVFSASSQAMLVPRDVVTAAITQTGTITGRVADSAGGGPSGDGIGGVSIAVQGTRLGAMSRPDGNFAIPGVLAGEHTLIARRLGYRIQSQSVIVRDKETTVADFKLARIPTALREIVVTATGDRERLEIGNAIGTIKADSVVSTSLIRNMSDLLTARTPGVIVSSTNGQVGSPSKVRIRGITSVAMSNDPIIILDGVRLTSRMTEVGRSGIAGSALDVGSVTAGDFPGFRGVQGGAVLGFNASPVFAPSRLDDIDPGSIESIDILRGPSAASLYGTEAAAGVIVIKTKRGGTGPFRFNLTADDGWSKLAGGMLLNWFGMGRLSDGTPTKTCVLFHPSQSQGVPNVVDGTCVQDSVVAFQPLNHPRMTTLGRGSARNVYASASGGTERLQEFLSVRWSDVVGIAKMSEAEKDRVQRMWGSPAPSWMRRPNAERAINGMSRTTFRATPRLDVSLSANVLYRNVLNSGVGSPGEGFSDRITSPADTLIYLTGENQRAKRTSSAKRGIGAITLNYVPRSWLTFRAVVGGDYALRSDVSHGRATECTQVLAPPAGCSSGRLSSRGETFVTTADVGAFFTAKPASWVSLRTAVGEQYSNTKFYELSASNNFNTRLAFGSELLTPAPITSTTGGQLYAVGENRDEAATAGWYVEETAAIRDRLFLTAALRQDVASAFGRNVNAAPPRYPKFGLSWLLSDEEFFPQNSYLTSARIRAAYGHSGQQASQRAVLNNYEVGNAFVDGALVPGIVLSAIGNPDLQPERGVEWEGGVDLSLLRNERIQLAFTLYRKMTHDAIMSTSLAPSYGTANARANATLSKFVNVGLVENRGSELTLRAKLVDSPGFTWELTTNVSDNANKLVEAAVPGLRSTSNSDWGGLAVGYPLFSYWGWPLLSYSDVNGDGILAPSEVRFGNDIVFQGAANPKREATYTNTLSVLNGALRLTGTLDHVVGRTVSRYAQPAAFAAVDNPMRGLVDRNSSLAEQAAAMEALYNGSWRHEASELRLAELSFTYNMPGDLARRWLRSRAASVTVAGRNLALWTDYSGKDPNVTRVFDDGFTSVLANLIPQPRSGLVRLSLGY